MSTNDISADLSRSSLYPQGAGEADLLRTFEAHLRGRGHSENTVRRYLESAQHFTVWFAKQAATGRVVDVAAVQCFLDEHLPVCTCPQPAPRDRKGVRAALNQLLIMSGQQRLRTRRPPPVEAIGAVISRFDAYLHDVCGVAKSTRIGRCRFVRDFLEATFGAEHLAYERITAELLLRYITEQAHRYRPGTMGVLVVTLRSFLRFLQFDGSPTAVLAEALPAPANWRLAALPTCLNDAQLDRFWNVLDRTTAVGKRDYAMARCLTDLALRCQEVANLSLDSIDWHAGIISLPHTKSLRADQLPLPEATGEALVDYLRQGRPHSMARSVFLSHRAPLGAPVTHRTVRGVVRRAFAKAGLPWTGTHVLRHTAATRLLQAGRPLKEVADVLRHRSLDTTVIYTKVDLPHLRGVALPWPEQQP